jgi:hypothetical protein
MHHSENGHRLVVNFVEDFIRETFNEMLANTVILFGKDKGRSLYELKPCMNRKRKSRPNPAR